MIKFPKSFDSYNSRYYGSLNAPEIPSKETLDELVEVRKKLNSVKHLNSDYSKEINRAMRDVSGYSDLMIKRLNSSSNSLYLNILKSVLLSQI